MSAPPILSEDASLTIIPIPYSLTDCTTLEIAASSLNAGLIIDMFRQFFSFFNFEFA